MELTQTHSSAAPTQTVLRKTDAIVSELAHVAKRGGAMTSLVRKDSYRLCVGLERGKWGAGSAS